MQKSTITTPLDNILRGGSTEQRDNYYLTNRTYMLLARENGSVVKFHKSRLGKQDYCFDGEFRYWVWEKEDWRIYVSDKKGFCFEVVEGLTPAQAIAAWEKYVWTVAYGSRKIKPNG